MVKLEKSDIVQIAATVVASLAFNIYNGASVTRLVVSTIIVGIALVAWCSFMNREIDAAGELDTATEAGNTAFYRFFIATDSRTAALIGFYTPISLFRMATTTDVTILVGAAACAAICGFGLVHLRSEHQRIVDFDEAPFLTAWYRSVGVMFGASLVAVLAYFAIRYAQWNGYARLPENLTFASRDNSEIILLLVAFSALLWWLTERVSRAAVQAAAATFYDGEDASVDTADIAAFMRRVADEEEARRRPLRAPGRAFGARVRGGRDPYA